MHLLAPVRRIWVSRGNLASTLAALVLLSVCGAQLAVGPFGSKHADTELILDLAKIVPSNLPGWEAKDLPLAATEYMTSVTKSTLNFDAYVYREYQRHEKQFAIYVAYWRPGRMPAQIVGEHTPDNCWTGSGYSREAAKDNVSLKNGSVSLPNSDWRIFSEPGSNHALIYVMYWHLVGGVSDNYGQLTHTLTYSWRWWRDAIRQMSGQSQDQVFIRISSPQPFDSFQNEPEFWGEIARLATLFRS